MYITSLTPHMHYRGKSMRFDVTYPDGRKETLLQVPNYDFNWQITYRAAQADLHSQRHASGDLREIRQFEEQSAES